MDIWLKDYRNHTGTRTDKHFKATLFRGKHILLGINCLEPGQVQPLHDHADQDKAYIVMEGHGYFTVGDDTHEAGPGEIVWAPAGHPHGVANRGTDRLSILVVISPPPPPK